MEVDLSGMYCDKNRDDLFAVKLWDVDIIPKSHCNLISLTKLMEKGQWQGTRRMVCLSKKADESLSLTSDSTPTLNDLSPKEKLLQEVATIKVAINLLKACKTSCRQSRWALSKLVQSGDITSLQITRHYLVWANVLHLWELWQNQVTTSHCGPNHKWCVQWRSNSDIDHSGCAS